MNHIDLDTRPLNADTRPGGPRSQRIQDELAQSPQDAIVQAIARLDEPLHVIESDAGFTLGKKSPARGVAGVLPPFPPERLGDRSFCTAHGARLPYVAGEMAGGIATPRMVIAMARAGMMGFFGAGGLPRERVAAAVAELTAALPGHRNWGVNLLHAPSEPAAEERTAELLLAHRVPAVSASAFMQLTPAVVRVAAHGLTRDVQGAVRRTTRLFAKVSRPEVAAQFMAPAPAELLRPLVERGLLTPGEAELAATVPVAEDITVEADSGGHTDNRPLTVLLPAMLALRDTLTERHGYSRPIRIGAAGGIGTPGATAAAFALGASYVVTGSVNQASVESGLSADAKALLSQAGLADVAMAPAGDMFELGVRLQVLRRGTMFAGRAEHLFQVYSAYPSWSAVPEADRTKIERDVLRAPYEQVWAGARTYWMEREPGQVERAERDPRHRMALVFRWYLGMSSRWAVQGETARRTDYQIWCGPAMGAFNEWAADGFLADPANRSVVQIARNLLTGAAAITRAHQLRGCGVEVPAAAFAFPARPLA
ncbi:PfaD family polyunsaturated fatty acid/polyketide biosynthesis protein [Streptomyces sp. NPDC058471]|uniref:PfaD family polyunsaturated fatty acid/polyketide biosynthesis protein n=1 Tax=Streptomyces sp. NPDC058471 TaxID=3346516 RepID=UPI00364FDA28